MGLNLWILLVCTYFLCHVSQFTPPWKIDSAHPVIKIKRSQRHTSWLFHGQPLEKPYTYVYEIIKYDLGLFYFFLYYGNIIMSCVRNKIGYISFYT